MSVKGFQRESHAVTGKPHDAAAVLSGLKFADNIHYKFKSSQALKAILQSSKHTILSQYMHRAVKRLVNI